MNLNHLKYFYYVAKYGGFLKAAKELHINQPGITKAVTELERHLGFQLFERVGKKVALSQKGSELYRYTESIFNQVEKIKSMSDEDKKEEYKGTLSFGCSDSIATHIVPEVLKKFLAIHSEVYPVYSSSTLNDLIQKLETQELEFLLVTHTPRGLPSVEVRKKIKVPHHLVIHTKEFQNKQVRSSFIGSREIENKSETSYPTLKRLQRDDPDASIKISTNNQNSHLALVKLGVGVSILPHFLVKKDLAAGVLKDVFPKEKFEWNLSIVCKRDHVLSVKAQGFIQMMEEAIT